MIQPKTLYEAITPLIVVNFIIGMGYLPSSTTLRKVIGVSYSILCLIIFGVLIKVSMSYVDYDERMNSFSSKTFQAIFYTNIAMTLCLILTGIWRIKIMQVAYVRITMCEKAFEQMELSKNYRNMYLYQVYAFVLVILIFTIFTVLNYNLMVEQDKMPFYIRFIIMLVAHYPIALLYVADISFLHWVRYSKIRFQQLNGLLQRMLTTTPDSPQHKRVLKMKDEWNKTFVSSAQQKEHRTKDNTDTMRAVKQVHLELIKCIRTANEAYGIQILLSMTVSFVFITTLLYNAYKIYWMDMPKSEMQQEMISFACWTLFYASKVFIINHMCALASLEAANTGDIICELYEPSTTKEFRAEIRDFTLQLIQNPLVFTACGFFTLDHTFIHGVIGSITTYLVILIQVGDITIDASNSTALANGTNVTITTLSNIL
ncbi:putative gustatory receptor 28a [Odontomachus brunneus]|uniref:putative gustatory receptor 28a n=1 Tax=Odontomachus brunneus TaxID=486640 RepID=UPI0013F26F4D|nr:putative gustatory receptor 28a [Odontomachus brunneus]